MLYLIIRDSAFGVRHLASNRKSQIANRKFQMIRLLPRLHPITRKRLQRFRAMRRAWWSFWILAIAYVLSLASNLICNERPLYAKINGNTYFPAFQFYSEKTVLGSGVETRADFKAIRESENFKPERGDRMIFAPFPYGPLESIDASKLKAADEVTIYFRPDPRVGAINVNGKYDIIRSTAAGYFVRDPDKPFTSEWELTPKVAEAVAARLRNENAPHVEDRIRSRDGREAIASLPEFKQRIEKPETVRITLRLAAETGIEGTSLAVDRSGRIGDSPPAVWNSLAESQRAGLLLSARERFDAMVAEKPVEVGGVRYAAEFQRPIVRFPFPPGEDHPLGLDSSGRDVLARVLYGMRVSMTFGIVLVIAAMFVGTIIGGTQGYRGGWIDLTGQRVTEIWEAIPFLYIIILLGSIYGRSFMLLLIVEALFGWIGISYYMRAEFLRLRRQPFVEAAKTQGLRGGKIMFGHILPNALVPIITFFPFYLVGAIGLLAALDYLGFGLPPPTPSWGELLGQGQEFLWAWWLIVYPAGALFFVMLLCVFIGEGLRAAFDPKAYTKLE